MCGMGSRTQVCRAEVMSALSETASQLMEGLVVGLKQDNEPWSEAEAGTLHDLFLDHFTLLTCRVAGLGLLCEVACAWPTDGGHVHTVLSHGQSSAGLSVGLGNQSRCKGLRSSGKPCWGEPRLWGTS